MPANSSSAVSADLIAVAVRSIHTMADGDRADFDPLYHPRAVDRENRVQPPSSRVQGPAGFYATALWLRAGFADLHYDIHHAVADGNLVAVNSTMSGRHVAPWAVYTDDGAVDTVFPPTNKTFAMTQSHWFRIDDGKILEHWANRDDLGMVPLVWRGDVPAVQLAGGEVLRPVPARVVAGGYVGPAGGQDGDAGLEHPVGARRHAARGLELPDAAGDTAKFRSCQVRPDGRDEAVRRV